MGYLIHILLALAFLADILIAPGLMVVAAELGRRDVSQETSAASMKEAALE